MEALLGLSSYKLPFPDYNPPSVRGLILDVLRNHPLNSR